GRDRPRLEAGLHQAQGHDARRGRGGGGGVGGDPAGAGGCERDPIVSGGLEGQMKRLWIAECGLRNGSTRSEDTVVLGASPCQSAIRNPQSAIIASLLLALASPPAGAQQVPQLPDSTGFGVHVLALARAPDSGVWVGTYGEGIFVLRRGAQTWEHQKYVRDTSAHSISFNFINGFAFGPKGQVWYGTVGNGWGLSTDNGKTWRNWEFGQLGPEWQYVAPNGIATLGDPTYIGTADGIKVTGDDGNTWSVITDSAGATTAKDPVIGRIQNQYVLAITAFQGSGQFP